MSDELKLNLGCGCFPLGKGWTNLDADPTTPADVHATIPPIPYGEGTVADIYMGHLLEHFTPGDGQALLRECWRVLKPGGRLGVVVPDTRAVMRRYLDGPETDIEVPQGQHWSGRDLDHLCAVFLYSTIQASPHRWSYDADTLARALLAAGFEQLRPIDRYRDRRIATHQWYGVGWDGVKP